MKPTRYKPLLFASILASLGFSQITLADFKTTVTLNGVTKSYNFPNVETALSVNQSSYRNDFINPDTGSIPSSYTGLITEFVLDNTAFTLINTTNNTVVIAPIDGISSDFITLTAQPGATAMKQLEHFFTNGTIPSSALLGVDQTTLATLNSIVAGIPSRDHKLINNLTADIAASKGTLSSTTSELFKELQLLFQKTACSTSRDDKTLANCSSGAIAGNPASLMGTMVDQIFQLTTTHGTSPNFRQLSASSDKNPSHFFGVDLQYGHFNLAGASVDTFTMPLSYTHKFNPKNQLIVSLPLTYISTGGNSSYQAGGSLAYQYNLIDNWSLTPAISYGYRGTPDSSNGINRTEGHLLAGTLTSKYLWQINPADAKSIKLTLNNMVGYFQTLDMNTTIGKTTYQTSGNVDNVVLKNGLSVSKTFGKVNIATVVTDTEYFGTHLYYEQYNEVGITLKPEHKHKSAWDTLNLNANYLFSVADGQAGNMDGFRLNLGYQF